MCGIAGAVWNVPESALSSDVLDRMTDVLQHRGPDGRGTHLQCSGDGWGVALGHRRLSIIDLAGGRQPLSNEEGTVWVTFNGEIYNYCELRSELKSFGHRFRTDSDTETIVHAYEQWGDKCLEKMRGMFAFGLWDARRRRLFLARDRLGQKPLVYCQQKHRLLFASEIKALLQVPGVPREVDPVALDAFLLYSYVPHPRTMFAGICKLPPAHCAVYENNRLEVRCYWDPDFSFETSQRPAELQEQLAAELSESVRLRLRSDVPLGAFLSGGIDSTTIVGLMQRHSAQTTKTYTIGFPVSDHDETEYARIAAHHLKTDHHEFQLQPQSIALLPVLAWHYDDAFSDSSAIPTYYVSQVTRQHVKVALTGDGGDELFAGYERYRTLQRLGAFEGLPQWVRRLLANPLWNCLPTRNLESSWARKLQFRMQILREPSDRRYAHWGAIFNDAQRRCLWSDEFAALVNGRSDPEQFTAAAMNRGAGRSLGKQAMLADLLTYLPGDLLTKVDLASMAHGLECRSPFLDHRVVELVASIPFRHLVHGKGVKPFVTATFPELIPPQLRTRGKMGFQIPLGHWFRHELRDFVRQILLSREALSRGYFRPAAVEELLAEHTNGHRNHESRIWTLLCLEAWHRTHIDPATAPTAPLTDLLPSGPARELQGSIKGTAVYLDS